MKEFIALLDQTLGLEASISLSIVTCSVCCLALRFFYLAKVRKIVALNQQNSISEIGFVSVSRLTPSIDMPFVVLLESVYHRFKNALFDFYLALPPSGDEDTAMVINNYKELIRIQDADQRMLKLVNASSSGEGIEQIEEFANKEKELEAMKSTITDLEQQVFDWKQHFSEKEELLRAKEQSHEQLEFELGEEQKKSAALLGEKETLEETLSQQKEEHEQEMSTLMLSFNKKEEQIRQADEANGHLENYIKELRAELQRSGGLCWR